MSYGSSSLIWELVGVTPVCGTAKFCVARGVGGAVFGVGGSMSINGRRDCALVVAAPMCREDPSVDRLDVGLVMGVAGAGAVGGACLRL